MAIRLLYRLFLQHLGQRRLRRAGSAGMAPVHRLPAGHPRDRQIPKFLAALAIPLLALIALGLHTLHFTAPPEIAAGPGATLHLEIDTVSPGPLVVYLSGPGLAPAELPADTKRPRIASENGTFVPHFQVLRPGSTIEAVNNDLIPHNTHVFNRGETVFNVALPLKDVSVEKTVRGFEIFSVRCDLHPWMQAWLFVPPSRHYAVLHDPGRIDFTDIPPGEYLLHLWQPDRPEGIRILRLSSEESKTLRLR